MWRCPTSLCQPDEAFVTIWRAAAAAASCRLRHHLTKSCRCAAAAAAALQMVTKPPTSR